MGIQIKISQEFAIQSQFTMYFLTPQINKNEKANYECFFNITGI